MKKSQKKLMIFELTLMIILLSNSFVLKILSKYNIVFFLIILIILFKKIFGLERERQRYEKDIIYETIITSTILFIIYYLLGLKTGYTRIENYYTYYGITTFIIPIIISTILKEYLRYNIIQKIENKKILIVMTIIIFSMLDITNITSKENFITSEKTFMYITLLLPIISNNIVSTYISKKVGYKANIIWLLIIRLYYYVIPIIPNLNEYMDSIIFIIIPIIIGYKVKRFYEKEEINKEEKEKKIDYVVTIITSIVIIITVYLTSGYFKYSALTIGSGSMNPEIKIGDVVVIEKIEKNYEELKEKEIIAYRKENVIVVHRIEEIKKEENKYYIYTKGDANEEIDKYVVKEEMIIGKVKYKIPYVGLPTIWLRGI